MDAAETTGAGTVTFTVMAAGETVTAGAETVTLGVAKVTAGAATLTACAATVTAGAVEAATVVAPSTNELDWTLSW